MQFTKSAAMIAVGIPSDTGSRNHHTADAASAILVRSAILRMDTVTAGLAIVLRAAAAFPSAAAVGTAMHLAEDFTSHLVDDGAK